MSDSDENYAAQIDDSLSDSSLDDPSPPEVVEQPEPIAKKKRVQSPAQKAALTPLKKLICSKNRAAPPDSPSKAPPSAGRPTDARGWCSGRRQTPPFCRRRVFERRWRGGAVGAGARSFGPTFSRST